MTSLYIGERYCLKVVEDRRIGVFHRTDPDALTNTSKDGIDAAIKMILPHAVPFNGPLNKEQVDWINRNTKGLWMNWNGVRFDHEVDAALFRLFHG